MSFCTFFTHVFLCLLGGRPRPHTPLNGILLFGDIYPYHQLFTPLNYVEFDIPDVCGPSYVLLTEGVHFLLGAVVSYLG